MNGPNDIEERLRKIQPATPSEVDEQILADATAEFERAAKVQAGRSWRIIGAMAVIIVLLLFVIVLLIGRGQIRQKRPEAAGPPEVMQQPTRTEEPAKTETAALPKTTEAAQADKTERPRPDDIQSRFLRIAEYASAGDVDALLKELETDDLTTKMTVVRFLSKMSDERAVEALNELAGQLDPNNPDDYFLAEFLGVEDFGLPEEEIVEVEEAEAEAETETPTEPNKPDVERERPLEQYATGWLTDENGYAVEGAIQVGEVNTVTDANSAFSIERPGSASFGYAVSTDGQIGAIFRWDKDEDLNDMEIVCVPFASASGLAVDVNAQPVNDVQIKIVPDVNESSAHVQGRFKGPWQIETEADGSFEITSIPIGYPLVLVVSRDDLSRRIPLDEPEPGEHMPLGEVVLEASLEENSIPGDG